MFLLEAPASQRRLWPSAAVDDPPSGGLVELVNGAGEEVSYVSSVDGLRVRWSGSARKQVGISASTEARVYPVPHAPQVPQVSQCGKYGNNNQQRFPPQ